VEQGSAPTTPTGAAIGELLLQGRYKAAALAILHANNRTEASPYRSALNEGRSFAAVLSVMPAGRAGMDRERALVQALVRFGCNQEQNEGVGCELEQNERFRLALKSALPFSMRLLWVNTFQSWLWNAATSARIALSDGPLAGDLVHEGDAPFTGADVEDDGEAAAGPDADANATSTTVRLVTEAELASLTQEGKDALARRIVIPLFGTKVQHAQHASGREYQLQLLAAGLPEGQTQAQAPTTVQSRILHAMPKGAYRRVYQWPGEFSMTEDQALETLSLSFSLPSGSYATSFIRELAACRKLL
jgi:tRNA(Glu) U13 pseudouridine synthase TruD